MAAPPFDAVVLAGGEAARLGGADKPGLVIAGRTLLDRVLAAVRQAQRRVVVGPPRPLPPDVIACREQPPGGGPVAALAAGLPHTRSEVVVVLAADLPWIGPGVPVLVATLAAPDGDAAALVDASGRPNLLASAWRRAALVGALTRVGDPAGRSMRLLASHADVRPVADPAGWGEDCDTWQDVEQAGGGLMNPLDDWIAQLAAELGVDPGAVDRDQLLAVARDAAHAVARPAAPLTTYLVGLAAGLRGGGSHAAREAAQTALRLAASRASSAGDELRAGVDVQPTAADQPGEQ